MSKKLTIKNIIAALIAIPFFIFLLKESFLVKAEKTETNLEYLTSYVAMQGAAETPERDRTTVDCIETNIRLFIKSDDKRLYEKSTKQSRDEIIGPLVKSCISSDQ